MVANGDCVVGSELQARIKNTADVNGTKHTDAKLSVVIASGNITVTEVLQGCCSAGARFIQSVQVVEK